MWPQALPTWPVVVDTICVAAVLSTVLISLLQLIVAWVKNTRGGHIQLSESFEPKSKKELFETKLLYHVAKETPEDGEPVEVASFWKDDLCQGSPHVGNFQQSCDTNCRNNRVTTLSWRIMALFS